MICDMCGQDFLDCECPYAYEREVFGVSLVEVAMFQIHDRTTGETFYTDSEDNASAFYEERARHYPKHDIIINRKDNDETDERDGDVQPMGGPRVAVIRGGATGTVRKAGTHG